MTNQKVTGKCFQWLVLVLLIGSTAVLCMCKGTRPLVAPLSDDTEVIYPSSNTSAEMILGTGGYDYGKSMVNSIHTQFGISCMNSCHMAPTMEWPNEANADSYKLISEDNVENVEVCNKCHPPAVKMGLHSFNSSMFNRAPIKDYDGDGTTEGVQDEVRGLLNVLLEAILGSGVKPLDEYPYWENVTTLAQKMAIYNFSFVSHDESMGIHNTARSVQLLQSSYKDLTGKEVPGAAKYSPVPGPDVQPSSIVIEPIMEIEGLVDKKGKPIRATALPNVGVGTYVILKGYSIDIGKDNPATKVKWSLVPPEGSGATLIEVDEKHVYFLADKQSWYEVKLTITDSKGTTAEGTLKIHSATYVGVGGVAGTSANAPQCASCHPGGAKSWAETTHAKAFANAIDGRNKPGDSTFAESNLATYTLAFDLSANNGGFDDVATKTGWKFPKKLQPGNWDAMPIELKQMASVQCESCHGPGGRWIAASISLNSGSCGYCHDSSIRNNKYEQWGESGHADVTSAAFSHAFSEDQAACLTCHSAEAFIDYTAGKKGSLRRFAGRVGFQPVTCAVCHDPHNAQYEAQLRVYDNVTMPNGKEAAKARAAAACMICHNGNTNPDQIDQDNPRYPHYSTAAEMLTGTGGYDYGKTVNDSMHKSIEINCVDCHMALDKGAKGLGKVGGHTFSMTSRDGIENIAACDNCHPDLTEFNRSANGDYDGNGIAQGVQDEIKGLLNILLAEIKKSGVKHQDRYPYWENVSTKAQKAAVYNFSFVSHDKSMGIHNTARAVVLLQRSFKDLAGKEVPGADIR